jgi:hypothetical protein
MTEHGDLHILLVGRRSEPEQVEEAADEQEGDWASHVQDRDRCAGPLLRR